jgi:glycosyltransferase involved in cell wall biosynthesis
MQARKKLVYILNYVNIDDSQHYVHVLRLLQHMTPLGWDVIVLSEKGGHGTKQVMGCEVRYLSQTGGPVRLFRQIYALWQLRRLGYRKVFTRITAPAGVVSALFAPLFGQTTYYWLSGTVLDVDAQKPFLARLKGRAMLRIIARCSRYFVTGPERMLDYYQQELQVPRRKLRLLYNDIDLNVFSGRPRETRSATADVVKLLLVHRLSPVRRTVFYFPHILDAVAQANAAGKTVAIDVIGTGPERPELEALCAQHRAGSCVTFHGAKPNNVLNAYYDAAHVFLMPTYREGFPRVLIEAMAHGLPIVSTDAGGVLDIIPSAQLPFISARDDGEQFGQNMLDLILNADQWPALSHANIEAVQRFDAPRVAQMFDAMLDEGA